MPRSLSYSVKKPCAHLLIVSCVSLLAGACDGSLQLKTSQTGAEASADMTQHMSGDADHTSQPREDMGEAGIDLGDTGQDAGMMRADMAPEPPALPRDPGLKRLDDQQYIQTLFHTSVAIAPELATDNNYLYRTKGGSFSDPEGRRYDFDDVMLGGLYSRFQTTQELNQRIEGVAPYDAYVRHAIFTATEMTRRTNSPFYTRLTQGDPSEAASKQRVEDWLREEGHIFLRRPMTEEEITYYRDVVTRYPLDGEHVRELLSTLMLAPNFLFVIEAGQEPLADQNTGRVLLNPYELASRLAMFLWQGPPDAELYELAKSGDLLQDNILSAQVRRMLMDPRSDLFFIKLGFEWLGVDERKDHINFGAVNANGQIKDEFEGAIERRIQEYLKEEREAQKRLMNDPADANPYRYNTDVYYKDLLNVLRHFIKRDLAGFMRHVIVTEQGTLSELFLNTSMTATDPYLAKLYGASEPWDGTGSPPTHDTARGGILGRIAFLATPTPRTRPVIRGLRIREHVLCADIPEPANADFVFTVPSNPPFSTRDLVAFSTERPEVQDCNSCHQFMNGLGYAFSHYNIFGRYRDEELYYFNNDEYNQLLTDAQRTEVQDYIQSQKEIFLARTGLTLDEVDDANDKYFISDMPRSIPVPIQTRAIPRIDVVDTTTSVETPYELAQLLAHREDVSDCFAHHVSHIALDGALYSEEDKALVEQAFASQSVVDAITTLVLTPSFRSKTFGDQLVPDP